MAYSLSASSDNQYHASKGSWDIVARLSKDVQRVELGAAVTTVIHGAAAGATTAAIAVNDADNNSSGVSLSYSSSGASLACSSSGSSSSVAALYSPYQFISRKHCSEQNVLAGATTAGATGAAASNYNNNNSTNSSSSSGSTDGQQQQQHQQQQRCKQCAHAGSGKPRVKWTKAGVEYEQEFDSVVIATQAYVALASLANPTDAEVV
eukprot:17839-Heterococcus_DN1.PRE.4